MNTVIDNKYVIVNEGELRTDVLAYCRANGLVMSKQCVLNGLNDSVFSNMRTAYARNRDAIDRVYNVTDVISVGRVQKAYYNDLLRIFNLKDKYILPVRELTDTSSTTSSISSKANDSEIAEQLKNIELSINRLGNVMMQILEKMPKQTVSNTLHIPDEKPTAKIKK